MANTLVADRAKHHPGKAAQSAGPDDEHPHAFRGVDEPSGRGRVDCAALNLNRREALNTGPDIPNEIVVRCFGHLIE